MNTDLSFGFGDNLVFTGSYQCLTEWADHFEWFDSISLGPVVLRAFYWVLPSFFFEYRAFVVFWNVLFVRFVLS